jgi:hypothetical protein
MCGKGIIDFSVAYGFLGNEVNAAKNRFIDILNRDEKVVIVDAIRKVRDEVLMPKDQLEVLMVLLDYDKSCMVGVDQPLYYRDLRSLLIRTIRSELAIATHYLAEYFEISKTYLYKLYGETDLEGNGVFREGDSHR